MAEATVLEHILSRHIDEQIDAEWGKTDRSVQTLQELLAQYYEQNVTHSGQMGRSWKLLEDERSMLCIRLGCILGTALGKNQNAREFMALVRKTCAKAGIVSS